MLQLGEKQKELVRSFAVPRPTRQIVVVTKNFIRHSILMFLEKKYLQQCLRNAKLASVAIYCIIRRKEDDCFVAYILLELRSRKIIIEIVSYFAGIVCSVYAFNEAFNAAVLVSIFILYCFMPLYKVLTEY